MARTRKAQAGHEISQAAATAGVLALLVDEREERTKGDKSVAKTEVLLTNAGLSVTDIVTLTGKNEAAVRKTIQRGRK